MRGATGEIRNSRSLSATNRLSKGRGAAANLILVLRGSSKSDPVSKDEDAPASAHTMCAAPGSFRDDDQKKKRGQPSIRIGGRIA